MRSKGSAEVLEGRRRIAGRLLQRGEGVVEVARILEVHPASVRRWRRALGRGGIEALAAKPHPGKPSRLSLEQKEKLTSLLLQGPLAAGFETDLWTCPRVAQLIEREFHVRYHPDHVWHVLHGLGWTCQQPERRVRQQDSQAVERWRREDWPRIKRGPQES